MTQTSRVWVNGVEDGGVPGDDPGLLLGLTVFETLRTYGRTTFRLDAHLERLEASALAMEINLPKRAEITRQIEAVCSENVYIRYTVTAGGNVVLQVAPIDESRVGGPVTVARMDWVNPSSLPGGVKHGARASWVLAAQRAGVDEVLLVEPNGHILEANRSNVFGVVGGELRTPPLDGRQLAGVTRSALMEAAQRTGITVTETGLHMDDAFDEFYLASTLKELAPVVSVNGCPRSGWGPLGLRLHQSFRDLVSEELSIDP